MQQSHLITNLDTGQCYCPKLKKEIATYYSPKGSKCSHCNTTIL